MATVRRRVCQLSSIPAFGASKSKVSSFSSSFQRAILDTFPVSGARHCSQSVKSNGKHLFFVDTSALGHHFSLLLHETEKIRNNLEMMRIELRHDMDKLRHDIYKVNARQQSDFNLGMGKIRVELSKQKAETNNLANKLDVLTSKFDGVSDNMINKLDGGLDSLRAQLEAAKYDSMKYFIGTTVSIVAVGLAVLRL